MSLGLYWLQASEFAPENVQELGMGCEFRLPNQSVATPEPRSKPDVSELAFSDSFVGCRVLASVLGFCPCNDTRPKGLPESSVREIARAPLESVHGGRPSSRRPGANERLCHRHGKACTWQLARSDTGPRQRRLAPAPFGIARGGRPRRPRGPA